MSRRRRSFPPITRHRDVLLAVLTAGLLLAIGARVPAFVQPDNLAEIVNDTAILVILATGQMLVILTRCIDLSVAANVALTGMVVASLDAANPELPIAVTVLISLVLGAFLGSLNGLLVWRLGIPAIVVTLGTMSIYRGSAFLVSGGAWVNSFEMSAMFVDLPRLEWLGLPLLSWSAAAIVAAMAVLLRALPLGRAFYATGGNPTAAVYTGIDVGRTQFWAFVISGTLAGLSGYLWVSRYAVAYVDVAAGFELQVVAAVVIGGVSIAGGIGTLRGCVLGALFLGVIKNALPVIDVSPFWQLAISGAVIVIAVVVNAGAERRRGRLILKSAQSAE